MNLRNSRQQNAAAILCQISVKGVALNILHFTLSTVNFFVFSLYYGLNLEVNCVLVSDLCVLEQFEEFSGD